MLYLQDRSPENLISDSFNALTMAFKSYHNEEAFEKKVIEYVIDGSTTGEMVLKKWSRVDSENKDWIWGRVETALAKKDGMTKEQQDRLAEIKTSIGR